MTEKWTSVSQAKCYLFCFKTQLSLNSPFHFLCPPDLLRLFGVAAIAKYFDGEGFEEVWQVEQKLLKGKIGGLFLSVNKQVKPKIY